MFGVTILASFVGYAVTTPPVEPKVEVEQPTVIQDTVAEKPVNASKVITVVDGDTVKVELDGVHETLRIIGLNTPETVDPRKPVECFGQEASNKAKELLDGQFVTLEADTTQGERDKYGRLLRYVFLPDGTDFGKWMISQGFAYEYTYSVGYKYQQDYKAAQREAESAQRGLWADGVCGRAQVASSCSCSSNTYNCSNFSTQASAQAAYDCCIAQVGSDIHKLDGADGDGLVCETLP